MSDAPQQYEGKPVEHVQPVVVVGIDGSEQSSKALAWAAEEARLRGACLRVVRAWNLPTYSLGYSGLSAVVFGDAPKLTAEEVEHQITEVLGFGPPVPIERVIELAQPANLILESAKGADLVVVGSRGRGGFAGLILGSVSLQVVHHAKCPVTVVH